MGQKKWRRLSGHTHQIFTMKDFPSTQEVFNLYEPEDLEILIKQNGFEIIKEAKQATKRTAVDGSQVQSIDICLVVKK